MKKSLLFVFLLLLGVSFSYAKEQTAEEALSGALAKLKAGMRSMNKAKAAAFKNDDFTLTFTKKNSKNTPLYYIYDMKDGGYIMAAADTRAQALLGYTDEGRFDAASACPAFQAWLKQCTEALDWLSQQPETATTARKAKKAALTTYVDPLLGKINFNQDAPYNLLCPKRTKDGKTQNAPTGCVATATAQVMAYHQWPQVGTGTHTNVKDTTQVVDFSQSVYDWANIKPTYNQDAQGDSAYAIALLLRDIGCAVDMNYGFDFSGSTTPEILHALTCHFGYDKSARVEYRNYYTSDDWNKMLRNELDNQRPIVFGANNLGGGHQFVLDGYDINGLYHVNWGWAGMSNGHFSIDYMDPDQQGIGGNPGGCYNMEQDCVVGVQKDVDGSSVATPHLLLENQIQYDYDADKFTFTVINRGIEAFAGEVGYVIYDPDNNDSIIATRSFSLKKKPLDVNTSRTFSYTPSDDLDIDKGYIIMPYYSLTKGGEMEPIPCELSAEKFLVAYTDDEGDLDWSYPSTLLPILTCSDVKIQHAYTGYAPKFQITITNSEKSKMPYNESISMYVSDSEQTYCYGEVECFINPGETKVLDFVCNQEYDDGVSYEDLEDGEYSYDIEMNRGAYPENILEGIKFTMTTPEESKITYSSFAIDKQELKKGETITATCKAKNKGGYTEKDYDFTIFTEDGRQADYISVEGVEIEANATTTITISGKVNLNPGNYIAAIYEYSEDGSKRCTKTLSFTVKDDATDIATVRDAAITQPSTIYDMTGRRVHRMAKGRLYIVNGKLKVKN